MLNQELLTETLETANVECWERERTATPVRAFAVRLHATGCSLRETQEILRLFGVERSHQAIFQSVHRVLGGLRAHGSTAPSVLELGPRWAWSPRTAPRVRPGLRSRTLRTDRRRAGRSGLRVPPRRHRSRGQPTPACSCLDIVVAAGVRPDKTTVAESLEDTVDRIPIVIASVGDLGDGSRLVKGVSAE